MWIDVAVFFIFLEYMWIHIMYFHKFQVNILVLIKWYDIGPLNYGELDWWIN